MGITYGDYLIDSGHYDPPEEEGPCIECDGTGWINEDERIHCPSCWHPHTQRNIEGA